MFMNHVSASVPERVVAVPRIAGRMRQRLLRARDYAGYERDVALLLMKSALAGVASWTVAQYFVTSPQPVYAPLVALLVVQSTVYRSLLHSVQYVAAVIAGVLAAGAASPLIGENVGAFAVMLVTALLVGRWRRLGTMGLQVPIVGIFAYNALLGAPATGMLWSIVSMVLLGAGVGLLVNLLLLPPMRYSTADRGVQELSTAVFVLLRDMAAGLREPIPEQDSAEDWLRRARRLDTTAGKARTAVEHGAESISYNPVRLFRRQLPVTFSGYRTMVESLARSGEQVRSIAFGLRNLLDDEAERTTDAEFLGPYAEVLDLVADSVQYVGSTEQEGQESLQRSVRFCGRRCEELQEEAMKSQVWPSLAALLIDAHRLVEELGRAHARGAVRAD